MKLSGSYNNTFANFQFATFHTKDTLHVVRGDKCQAPYVVCLRDRDTWFSFWRRYCINRRLLCKGSERNNSDFSIRNCTTSSLIFMSSQSSHSQLCCGCEDIKTSEPAAHLRPKNSKLFLTEPLGRCTIKFYNFQTLFATHIA